jgi:UDP:flavonoid glycosyltransferase YjiC (YdhE family)
MKRIVFCTVGSLGDVHPYLAIARQLLARGHRPVIATTDRHRSAIEAGGIEYAPLRPGEATFGGLETVAAKLFEPHSGPRYLIREMVMPYLREQYEDCMKASHGADVVVSHPLTMAAPLVCAMTGVPWVSSVLAPASLLSAYDRPLLSSSFLAHALRSFGVAPYRACLWLGDRIARGWERPLHDLRAELGLPRAAHAALFRGQFSPRLTLALFPRILAKREPDWPANTLVTGAPRYDGLPASKSLTRDLDAFMAGGEPPLVFALGSSVVMLAGDFWDNAIDASQRVGRRAILLTGSPLARTLPSSVRAFDYLPYSAVFPRAAAVVHQAGIGTLTQALAAGRPQLAVPVAFDQPDNARRAVELGVGRSITMRKVTAARLAKALAALLAEPAYALRAGAAATEIEDGSARAADALLASLSSERLVS